MGGGQGEAAALRVLIVGGNTLDGIHRLHDLTRDLDDVLPGGGHLGQVFATTNEDLKADLFLQQPDLLADPGLGGE